MSNDIIELSKLTSKKFEKLLKEDPGIITVMPFGSIEQHGPHLPIGTDFIGAKSICIEICKLTANLYVPTIKYGVSLNHKGWPGTVSISSDIYSNLILEIITGLYQNGLRRFLWINHHSGNFPSLYLIKQRLMFSLPGIQIAIPSYPFQIKMRKYLTLDIHAGKAETDFMLSIAPELVDQEIIHSISKKNKLPPYIKNLLKNSNNSIKQVLLDACLPPFTSDISFDGIISTLSPSESKGNSKEFIKKWIEYIKELIIEWKKLPIEY